MRRWLFLAAALCGACKGDLPSGSTGPAPTPAPLPTLVVRDGATENVVPAEVSPADPPLGTITTARAPGFLVREDRFMGDPFYLWPQPGEYVQALVYGRDPPWNRLLRWAGGFTVSSEGLDAEDLDTLHEAVTEAAAVTGLPITVAPTGQVTVVVNPSAPYFEQNRRAIAYAQVYTRAHVITRAEVVFLARKYVSSGRVSRRHNTMLHEIGHVLGLTHSMDPADVMSAADDRREERTFGAAERLALKVMYRWRAAGNSFPDSAIPPPAAADARERVFVIED